MKIAFYAPLKSPHHPVPSGDRLMARQLVAALQANGHAVEVVSELRSFARDPDAARSPALRAAADAEVARIKNLWQGEGAADLWFCYHPYYKAPDLLGPGLCRTFGIPYVTAETSYSARRNLAGWADAQAQVLDSIAQAAVNICLTRRDLDGLLAGSPAARVALLPPFIDAGPFLAKHPEPRQNQLIAVAMMRAGDKFDSFVLLAEALARIADQPWTLSVVGDGPLRAKVMALFDGFAPGRIVWHGEQTAQQIAALFSRATLYVWPGCGEAYGLAYLEAQAAGLPVIAQNTAGVPEVVRAGKTGILTPPGDVGAYAEAVRQLLHDNLQRLAMAEAARSFVREQRSQGMAAARLDAILKDLAS
jgi:glycosyltransferase involved in cell wall biosynthesis